MSLRTPSLEVAFLVLAAPLAVWWIRPPRALGLDAPATSFSAARAARHLEWIAAEPRPAFGARNAWVRQRLVEELEALGLEVRTQALTVVEGVESAAGTNGEAVLVNVLGRRRGTGSGGALLLAAHHDSVVASPGAADDGAAVAALLEALRALGDAARANDLIVLLSDGEELGLVGAGAFADFDPWLADVRAVANFEARGAGGPSILFQTGPRSGGLVERYARAAPHPFGSSLAAAVYERMPNDTDLTVFLQRGLPGLNFAFLGGGAAYHQPADRPEALDPGSLQQHGEAMLAVARELLDADLDRVLVEGELEFFPVPGGLARWPQRWTPFAALALALVVTAACARRAPLAAVRGALQAVLVSCTAALAAIGLAWGARALVLFLGVESEAGPGANLCSSEALTVGAWWCALGAGLLVVRLLESRSARSPERTELERGSLARGALLVWSFLAVMLALAVPGGGHVGLVALLGAGLAHAVRMGPPTRARSFLACVLWLPAAVVLLVLQALLVQVGSVLPAAEFRLGGLMSGVALLAALPLLARASGRADPPRLAWRGAAGVCLAGVIVLAGSAVLRASGS